MNIVESLLGQFSNDLRQKLGGLIGANEGEMENLTQAGIPCVLSGLALIASKPSGAAMIAKALESMDSNAFGYPEKILESGAMNAGGSLVSNLLGGSLVEQISAVLSEYAKVSVSTSKVCLGYLTPFALGAVGAVHPKDLSFDEKSVSDLFRTQRQSIVSAIPTELEISKVPSLKSFAVRPFRDDLESSREQSGMLGKSLVAIAVVAALIVGGIFIFDSKRAAERLKNQRAPILRSERPKMSLATSGALTMTFDQTEVVTKIEVIPKAVTSLKLRVKQLVDRLATTVESLDDAISAEASSKRLSEVISNLDALAASSKSMPAEGRSVVASLAKSYSKQLNPLIETALLMPDLSDSIRDSLQQIRDKLQDLAS